MNRRGFLSSSRIDKDVNQSKLKPSNSSDSVDEITRSPRIDLNKYKNMIDILASTAK